MSYRITMDGEAFCASTVEHSAVIDPVVNLEANRAGSLTFTITPDHPHYNDIVLRSSIFDVWQNGKLIFSGVPIQESLDFWNRKTITCEGELGYLNDSIQRQAVYQQQTVSSLLGAYLTAHNAQADASKQFQLGSVTVNGGNQIYRYTNYNNTMTEISEDLVDNFGGFLRVRHENGVRLLDYLASSPHTSSQIIRIGQNLVDLSRNLSSLDICTVLIPLGANTGNQLIDGLDERVTIESVNDGKDYIIGTAVSTYGHIWRTHTWDDVTTPTALLAKGQEYLSDVQYADLVIEASALDLGLADEDVERFELLDMIRVVSDPHGLDRYFLLSKLQINLDHPAETKITLGLNTNYSMSARSAQNAVAIERQNTAIMVNASENARQILDNATDGAIQILFNENGVAYELRINNSSNPDTATKWWRYNSGGWGYTNDGGQTYTVAATMDGTIFANLIKAGILSSDNGKFYVDMETGAAELQDITLSGGSINLGPNVFTVSSFGAVVANSLKSNNATITGGSLSVEGNAISDTKVTVKSGNFAAKLSAGYLDIGQTSSQNTSLSSTGVVGRNAVNGQTAFSLQGVGNGILNLYDTSSPSKITATLDNTGLSLYSNGVLRNKITTGGALNFYNSSGVLRATLGVTGLFFYNDDGSMTGRHQYPY